MIPSRATHCGLRGGSGHFAPIQTQRTLYSVEIHQILMKTKPPSQISSSAMQLAGVLTLPAPPGLPLTTDQALRRVIEAAAGQVGRTALSRYEFCAARIGAALGSFPIHLVAPEQFAGFLATLRHRNANGVSRSTKNDYVAIFRVAMRAAGGGGFPPPLLSLAETAFTYYSNDEFKRMFAAVRREERGFLLCMTHLAIRRLEMAKLAPGCIDVAAQRCTLSSLTVIEGNRLDEKRVLIPGVPRSVWEMFAACPLEQLRRPWNAVRHSLRCAVSRTVSPNSLRMTAAFNYAALYGSDEAARICRCDRYLLRRVVANGPTEAEALEYFDLAALLNRAV